MASPVHTVPTTQYSEFSKTCLREYQGWCSQTETELVSSSLLLDYLQEGFPNETKLPKDIRSKIGKFFCLLKVSAQDDALIIDLFDGRDMQIHHQVRYVQVTRATQPSSPSPLSWSFNHPNYQVSKLDRTFPGLLNLYLNDSSILTNFHSNVLPIINSTGTGKTRFMLEQCRSFQNKPDEYNATYFTFPRYKGSEILETWPNASPKFLSFFQHVLNRFKHLSTQLDRQKGSRISFTVPDDLKAISRSLLDTDFVQLGARIVDTATKLFNKVESLPIADATTTLTSKLPDLKYILFTDEASSLLYNEPYHDIHLFLNQGNDSSNVLDCDWNLFRCLRHAARNIRHYLTLMIVVAGTHTSLSNFCHDVQKAGTYRPGTIYPFSLAKIFSGITISPVSNGSIQLFEDFYLKTDISLLLSLQNALSCRPLWVSYMKYQESKTPGSSLLLSNVAQLIESKVDASFGITNLQAEVAAFLTIMLPGVAIHESLLTKFVQYSLAIVEFSTVKSNDGVELSYSYLRPSVDPLVAHFAWKRF
ncbi:hypothetical protein GEMRC1_008398 [Eukaryota sp. GEM-RC1]